MLALPPIEDSPVVKKAKVAPRPAAEVVLCDSDSDDEIVRLGKYPPSSREAGAR